MVEPGRQSTRPQKGALGLLVLALAVFFLPALLPAKTFFARDTLRMHGPIRQYAAERITSGELPLWWPYEGLGAPFLAQAVTSVLHPLALLSTPLSTPNALRFVTLACFLLGALGVFALGRRLSLTPFVATFSALCWAFSGYTVSTSDNWFYLAGANTVPWFLWAVDRTVQGQRWSFSNVAWVLASVLVLGDFEAAYVMTGVGFVFGLVRAPEGARLRGFAHMLLGVVTAALLASVQLVSSWELLGHTARGEGLLEKETMRWSLHPFRLVEWVWGRVLPEQGGKFEYSRLLMGEPLAGTWANCVHVGLLALTLGVCAALFARRLSDTGLKKWAWFCVGLVLLALVMALGKYGGLYGLALKVVPLWKSFRFPEKLLPFAGLPVALLAGAALQHAEKLPLSRVLGAATLLSTFLTWALWAFPEALAQGMLRVDTVAGPSTAELRTQAAMDMLATALSSAWKSTGFMALATFSWWLLSRRNVTWAKAALGFLTVCQLASVTHSAFEVTDHDMYTFKPALVKALLGKADEGRFRFVTLTGTKPFFTPQREGFSKTENLSFSEKNTLSPSFNASWKLDNLNPYLPGALENLAELRRKSGNWARVGALFSTRYLVLRKSEWDAVPQKPATAQVLEEAPELDLLVLDTQDAVPRAYLACAESFSNRSQAQQRMMADDFPRGKQVVSWGDVDLPGCGTPLEEDDSAQILRYQPEEVQLQTQSSRPSVLVLNDAFYPGWEATVDGQPAPIALVNLAVRGVSVPSGSHEVIFRYQPRWLLPSLWVSSLVALVLLAGVLFERRHLRKSTKSDK